MHESVNVWGIKEFEGDGVSCPIVPANLPWHKKVALTFFRFGVCPLCVTLSLTYSAGRFFRKLINVTNPEGEGAFGQGKRIKPVGIGGNTRAAGFAGGRYGYTNQ